MGQLAIFYVKNQSVCGTNPVVVVYSHKGKHLFDAYWMGIAANIYVILGLICLVTSICSNEQHRPCKGPCHFEVCTGSF